MKIRRRNYLYTDNTGKEVSDEGLELFPLAVNDADINDYVGGQIPSHWHDELEIFVLKEGKINIGIGDSCYHLRAGDGCFINSGILHSFTSETSAPCAYRSFVFGADIVGGMPGSVFDTVYVRPLLEEGVSFQLFQKEMGDGCFFEEFDRAFAACEEEASGYEFQIRSALSKILLYTKSKNPELSTRTAQSVHERRIKEMIAWIHSHLLQNLTVTEIAESVNICTRECQRIFQKYLHCSPTEYVLRLRIFRAAGLLMESSLSITEIALNCGFSNPSYFSKQFKALTGSTPREYRAAVWRQTEKK